MSPLRCTHVGDEFTVEQSGFFYRVIANGPILLSATVEGPWRSINPANVPTDVLHEIAKRCIPKETT